MQEPDSVVFCTQCGARNNAGARFCSACGSALGDGASARAEPLPPPPPPYSEPPPPSVQPGPPQARSGGGCLSCGLTGCLVVFVAIVLIGGVGAALYFKVPQQLGIVQSPAQTMLTGNPDRPAASAILAELKTGGADTKGMSLYVLPFKSPKGSLAYLVLDQQTGFKFPPKGKTDPLLDLMGRVATGSAAREAGVRRVAVEYRGAGGETLLLLTGSTETIAGFQQGRISRADLLAKLEGNANWPAFYREVLGQ